MPGAHTDVGGGYSNHFLSDASLLLLIERIKEHTVVGIDDTVVDDLLRTINNVDQEEVIIHSEIKGLKDRFLYGQARRKIDVFPPANPRFEYASPVAKLLEQKKLYLQKTRSNVIFKSKDFGIQRYIASDWLA